VRVRREKQLTGKESETNTSFFRKLFSRTVKRSKLKNRALAPAGVPMSDAGENRSKFRVILDFLKRLLGKKSAPPGDPYAYAMAPLLRGPKGRSGAAVAEIEEDGYQRFPVRRS